MGDVQGDKIVTTQFIAEFCGVTTRYCNMLADDGHMHRQGRGKFWLLDSLRRYTQFLQGKARLRNQNANQSPEDADALLREKVRLTRAQADSEELKVAIARATVCPQDAVEAELRRLAGAFAQLLETLPDILERNIGLPPEHIDAVQRICDEERDRIADALDRERSAA